MVDFAGSGEGGADSRLAGLWACIGTDAADHDEPVGLDALCRVAAARAVGSTVAVSVPSAALGAELIAAAGTPARFAEELQITVGQGPSLDALGAGGVLSVPDLSAASVSARWPLFGPEAVAAGVRSLCVVPLRVGAARFGVLVFYLDRVGGLDTDQLAEATVSAVLALELVLDYLEGRVAEANRAADADTDAGSAPRFRSRRSLDDHAVIHQATGMAAVQLGVDMQTALLRLRAHAFAQGRLLTAVAAEVVSRTLRLDPDGEADR